MSGRFDWRYELDNIERGMSQDLQREVGQTVAWFIYDPITSAPDPVYDTGSTSVGRRWLPPLRIPVMSAIKVEAGETQNDRGLYTVSTLRLVLSIKDARAAGLGDLVFNPEKHVIDRVVYESKVFGIDQVRTRGVLTADYAVIGVDCTQVKAEEMVNDPQFRAYMPFDQD